MYNKTTLKTNATSMQARWSCVDCTGDVPIARSSSCAGVINDVLYVFSGENQPRTPIDADLFALDINTCVWTRHKAREERWPLARIGHAATTTGGKLYMFAGRAGIGMGDSALGDCWVLDPKKVNEDECWESVVLEGNIPHPSSYHSMTSSEDSLFIFGGCLISHGRCNDLFSFDFKTQKWAKDNFDQDPNPHPVARGGASVVYASDGVHVLFGYNGSKELSDHWLYDYDVRKWIPLNNPTGSAPPARSVTDVVYLAKVGKQGSLFVFGGEYTPSDKGHEGAGVFHDDSWLFDIASRKWTEVTTETKPVARGWFNTCTLHDGKSAVIFGGLAEQGKRQDVWVISFE